MQSQRSGRTRGTPDPTSNATVPASNGHPSNERLEDDNERDWDVITDDDFSRSAPRPRNNTDSSSWIFQFRLQVGRLNRTYIAHSGNWQTAVSYREPASQSPPAGKMLESAEKNLQPQSPFFQLPAELRIRIYEELFSLPPGTAVRSDRSTGNTPSILSILQTCCRALVEAEEIFYSINRFCGGAKTSSSQSASSSSGFGSTRFSFTRSESREVTVRNDFGGSQPPPMSLSPRRREAITKWSIVCAQPPMSEIRALSLATPHLRSLHIYVMIPMRYLSVSAWRVLAPNLDAELKKLRHLQELKIAVPEAAGPPELSEPDKKTKFEDFVRRLQEGVASRNGTSSTLDL